MRSVYSGAIRMAPLLPTFTPLFRPCGARNDGRIGGDRLVRAVPCRAAVPATLANRQRCVDVRHHAADRLKE